MKGMPDLHSNQQSIQQDQDTHDVVKAIGLDEGLLRKRSNANSCNSAKIIGQEKHLTHTCIWSHQEHCFPAQVWFYWRLVPPVWFHWFGSTRLVPPVWFHRSGSTGLVPPVWFHLRLVPPRLVPPASGSTRSGSTTSGSTGLVPPGLVPPVWLNQARPHAHRACDSSSLASHLVCPKHLSHIISAKHFHSLTTL